MKIKTKKKYLFQEHVLMSRFLRDSDIMPNSKLHGLDLARHYSISFQLSVENVYQQLIKDYHDCVIAVGLYGSAGRKEMASHSDADVIIITGSESYREQDFRKKFREKLAEFGYAKVDIPDWGTVKQLTKIARSNIVEGNQVLEAKIVCGNFNLARSYKNRIKKILTPERSKRNLLFQWFCYDHYYKTRQKENYINIKYSHGGTRDIMFFSWLARHEAMKNALIPTEDISDSLRLLHYLNVINELEHQRLLESISHILLLRSEILKLNQTSDHRGLSLIDQKMEMIRQSRTLFYMCNIYGTDIYTKSMKYIARVKHRLMKRFVKENYIESAALILKARTKNLPKQTIQKIIQKNQHEQILSIIWTQNELLSSNQIITIMSNNRKSRMFWELLASILCISNLNPSIIDEIAAISFSKPEYGYLLKMIAQHPRTNRFTLKKIINQPIGKRYKELASIALKTNFKDANLQI